MKAWAEKLIEKHDLDRKTIIRQGAGETYLYVLVNALRKVSQEINEVLLPECIEAERKLGENAEKELYVEIILDAISTVDYWCIHPKNPNRIGQ